jgi:hypothetical protein
MIAGPARQTLHTYMQLKLVLAVLLGCCLNPTLAYEAAAACVGL